jgi:hypothetical protein
VLAHSPSSELPDSSIRLNCDRGEQSRAGYLGDLAGHDVALLAPGVGAAGRGGGEERDEEQEQQLLRARCRHRALLCSGVLHCFADRCTTGRSDGSCFGSGLSYLSPPSARRM